MGSIDLTAASRSVLMVQEDEEAKQRGEEGIERKISHIKCNVAEIGGQLRYTVHRGRFYWIGDQGEWTEPAGRTAHRETPETKSFYARVVDGEMVLEPVDGGEPGLAG